MRDLADYDLAFGLIDNIDVINNIGDIPDSTNNPGGLDGTITDGEVAWMAARTSKSASDTNEALKQLSYPRLR